MSAVLFLNLFLCCQARFAGFRDDERRAVFVQPIDITPVNLAENLAKAVEMAAITVGGRYSVAALGEQLDQILNSEKVGNNGDIASTLTLALYCFENSKSFDSCIHIVRQDIAGEKKLISAVAGSFAGVYYKLYGRPIQDVSRYEKVINGLD